MKRLTILLFLCLFSNQLIAQKQANIWGFWDYQLDFNEGSPVVKSEFANNLNRGMGIISDENGSLLFYTDGYSVWNKNHELMPNGTDLIPSAGSPAVQESIIIPKPGADNECFIFTVDPWNGQQGSGLYYSVVNLSLEEGLGDVTSKGVKVVGNTTNKISATMHSNGQDIWLMIHLHNTNFYYSFLITSAGLSGNQVLNQIGKAHGFWDGQLKFSPDGKKAACSRGHPYADKSTFDLFDFDNSTGILSNALSFVLPGDGQSEGIEFSPDAKKLYVVQAGGGLHQFDLIDPSFEAISGSRILLHKELYNNFRQMQLGPDNNIYITKGGGGGGTNHLGVISNTNAKGPDVLVEDNGLYLEGGNSFVNFTPNFIQDYFFKTSFTFENSCQAKPTIFKITNDHQLDSVKWFFGEGSTSTSLNPEFTYNVAGSYQVELVAYYQYRTDTISREITINPFPILEMGSDTTVCFGSEISVSDLYSSYNWNLGDTTYSINAETEGWYKLEVKNKFGCSSMDSMFVSIVGLPQINLPDSVLIDRGDSVLLNPGDFESYSWSTGETSPSIYLSDEGWFSVLVTNESGCKSSKSFHIAFNGMHQPAEKPKWVRLNPKPSVLRGNDMHFINDKTGFIVNNSQLLRTTDGGDSWEILMSIASGKRIAFKDSFGYIIGNYGTIYKSTHNGGGWNKIQTNFTDNLNAISLIHHDTLLITSDDMLFISNDGGQSWTVREVEGVDIEDSFFINSKVGHLACKNGTILKTIDGGLSWYVTESSNSFPSDFFRITFVNENIGFATREHNELYKTNDGGETWHAMKGTIDAGYAIQFLNPNVGFMAGDHGAIHKTFDGGNTWEWIGFDGRRYGNNLYSIFFLNELEGYATGLRGRIIRTYDGGKTWSGYSPTYARISQIALTSESTVYGLVGNEIIKSTDKGGTWSNMGAPLPGAKTKELDFINDNIGYAIVGGRIGTSGNSRSVFKTIDGARTWVKTHETNALVNDLIHTISFINENVGFVNTGGMRKTIDGGKTWRTIESFRSNQIQFLDSLVGYAKNFNNYYGRIYKTSDGGETWDMVFEVEEDIRAFHFVNETVGYLVGDQALMHKTTDGGETWQKLEIPYDWYKDVKFLTENFGYISDEDGRVYATLDGGNTWQREVELFGTPSIDVLGNTVYVSGDNGNILRSVTIDDRINFKKLQVSNLRNSSATITSHLTSSLDFTSVLFEYGQQGDGFNHVIAYDDYSGYISKPLSFDLEALQESTTYYCRFKAVNKGLEVVSQTITFTTMSYKDLIRINPLKIDLITDSSATIKSNVISYLAQINLFIDIGEESNNYGISEKIGSFTTEINEEIVYTIDGLDPSTKYFCRLKILDGDKTIVGEESSFTTEEKIVVGIGNKLRETKIYPNPTNGTITLEGVFGPYESFILDPFGQKIVNENVDGHSIDISGLDSGIYFLVIVQGDFKTVRKIIKH